MKTPECTYTSDGTEKGQHDDQTTAACWVTPGSGEALG